MAGRKRPGGLSAEDRALWEHVKRSARPLERRTASAPAPATLGPAVALPERLMDTASHGPGPTRLIQPEGRPLPPHAISLGEAHPAPVGRPEPGLDRRTAEKLRRGDRAPDARIDLHGMTAERAHARLDSFIRQSLRAGHRCVLVITGKGGRMDRGEDAAFMRPDRGVLRDAAPRWLRSGPMRGRIVGIYEAHQRHGGGGAFYVYLKRAR